MTAKEYFEKLTLTEKGLIEAFADSGMQFQSVMDMIKFSIKSERSKLVRSLMDGFVKGTGTNEEAGAKLRAYAEALRLVDAAFADLAQCRRELPTTGRSNPAR